jgi:hypothetical protein
MKDNELTWKMILVVLVAAIGLIFLAVIVSAGAVNLWNYLT